MPVGVLTVPWAQTREPSLWGHCLCCAAFSPRSAAAARPPTYDLRSRCPLVPVHLHRGDHAAAALVMNTDVAAAR